MFYDKQSNNQVLRMQTMHTGMPIVNEAEELKLVVTRGGVFLIF
jgi:mediator of RNA polymerase II transcription subunit 6